MGQYVAIGRSCRRPVDLRSACRNIRSSRSPAGRRCRRAVLDEDTYPVGGFASISTKGSVESLLHSQLAYMEREAELRPDLFDVKYLRERALLLLSR